MLLSLTASQSCDATTVPATVYACLLAPVMPTPWLHTTGQKAPRLCATPVEACILP